jgi:hypothetical protein
MTKHEIDLLLRALRANTKAAKASILATGPKLKADFEIQLKTIYPPDGDPVWIEAFKHLSAERQKCQDGVEARCKEIGIAERFRPRLYQIGWNYGEHHMFKEVRDEYRRLAHLQIDELIKSKIAALEKDSTQVQLEILSNGFVTPAAKEFFERLPKIETLIQPLSIAEISALLNGKRLPSTINGLPSPVLKLLQEESSESD